jgi:glycerol-3-phosphate O-acyltransferase
MAAEQAKNIAITPIDGPTAPSPEVLFVEARTPTERELIRRWAATTHPYAQLMEHGDPGLAFQLERGDDVLVVPARVTWLPSADEVDVIPTARGNLIALFSPRRPPALLQRWIVRHDPTRARFTVGEPASAAALRAEFRAETGGTSGREGFVAFVERRATVACDRAERVTIGDRYKVPRLVAEQITASARSRERIAELARRLGRPFDDVLAELTDDLHELAAVQSPPAIDAFRALMGPMHRKAWAVEADVDGLDRLRELNRDHGLVFLPSHRSYADPLLLADVLHRNNFPRNHVLGGINMAFWPLGPLGKRAGVIFIRRTFGKDEVYKLAIREYFGYLVAKRFNLEWYIEGGRTRTGKLRSPRFGLLRYLVRAIEDGHADDVILAPVSIVYDQLPEVGMMSAEQAGTKKSAEGIGWFVRYVRGQSRDAGTARVRFGEPLSLRKALDEAGQDSNQLDKVAFHILDEINRATPVSATALVTFALLDVGDRAVTLDQTRAITAPLLDYLESRGVAGPVADLRDAAALKRTLTALVKAGAATCFDGGLEPVWSVAPGHHRVAAFYRNAALHHLVNRAILELALTRAGEQPAASDVVDTVWAEAMRLRDLLKYEFFFAPKPAFREELAAELEALGWRPGEVLTGELAADLIDRTPFRVAPGTLRSFVEAQLVVADRLAERSPHTALDRDELLTDCVGYGRQLVLQGRIHGGESVSRAVFEAAWELAANRDLVDPGGDDVTQARIAWRAELTEVRDRLERIAAAYANRLGEILDGHRP